MALGPTGLSSVIHTLAFLTWRGREGWDRAVNSSITKGVASGVPVLGADPCWGGVGGGGRVTKRAGAVLPALLQAQPSH